jgi:3-methyladenine DNA glycosylase AlkC
MANEYINQKLLHLQEISKSTLIDLQKKNEPKIIEMMRLVSKTASDCANKNKKLDAIQDCHSQVMAIQSSHYEEEATIVNKSVGDYGGCIIKAHKLYQITGSTSIFEKYTDRCFKRFKEGISIKIDNLIDEDLKVLQTMK